MKTLLRWIRGASSPPPPASAADPGAAELDRLAPFALGGVKVLAKLQRIARDVVARKVPGDFVECGVLNGGSAAAITTAYRDTTSRAWPYDSFEGMPATVEKDGPLAAQFVGACKGTEASARAALRLAGFPEDRLVLRKGWFQQTFQEPLPGTVSLLHLDCDWYESVLLSLRTFYDRVSEGGVVILDDFGHWEGCREAFYDFAAERKLRPLLERFGHTQAFWVKNRTHNRDFLGQWEIP